MTLLYDTVSLTGAADAVAAGFADDATPDEADDAGLATGEPPHALMSSVATNPNAAVRNIPWTPSWIALDQSYEPLKKQGPDRGSLVSAGCG
ncbi:MAG: hypothetical protein NVS1B1_04450 [Candidatus Limnocylindrales bacterium]